MFVFLAAIIVIVATVFVGIKLFGGVRSTACQASDVQFMRDMRQALDDNAAFGSRNDVSIMPNCDATLLCFVDPSQIGNASLAASNATERPLVTLIKNGVNATVYEFSPSKGFLQVGYDERVRPAGTVAASAYLCVGKDAGKFTFHTEGRGRTITVLP